LLKQPQLIPERLYEKYLTAQAYRFYQQRTTLENDAERRTFFREDISAYVEEACQLPVYRRLTESSDTDKPMMRVALRQTTSPDDCVTMYVLVRVFKPQVMVETGVFYGALSAIVLSAMARNGAGRLYSIDLPMESDQLDASWRGSLVPDELRPNWQLVLGDSRVELPPLLERLGRVDAFNHDSLHTTRHMTWEFETAWPYLKPGGVLSSHDVLTTPSWQRFCQQHRADISVCGRVYGLGIAVKSAP
jgi:hypothetical protein